MGTKLTFSYFSTFPHVEVTAVIGRRSPCSNQFSTYPRQDLLNDTEESVFILLWNTALIQTSEHFMGLDCRFLQLVLHVWNKDRENIVKEGQAKPVYGIIQIIFGAFLFILIKETQSLETAPSSEIAFSTVTAYFFWEFALYKYLLVVYHRARASDSVKIISQSKSRKLCYRVLLHLSVNQPLSYWRAALPLLVLFSWFKH